VDFEVEDDELFDSTKDPGRLNLMMRTRYAYIWFHARIIINTLDIDKPRP